MAVVVEVEEIMRIEEGWKNTSASFRTMIILSLICVYIFYFITFDFSEDYTLITWPIVISIGIIAFSSRMMNTLKYRLQKKFVNKTSSQISESISNSLNHLNLPFTIKHQTLIASNPEVVADTLFIISEPELKIGLVSYKNGTWAFIMYHKDTLKNDLIKICKEIDDTISVPT